MNNFLFKQHLKTETLVANLIICLSVFVLAGFGHADGFRYPDIMEVLASEDDNRHLYDMNRIVEQPSGEGSVTFLEFIKTEPSKDNKSFSIRYPDNFIVTVTQIFEGKSGYNITYKDLVSGNTRKCDFVPDESSYGVKRPVYIEFTPEYEALLADLISGIDSISDFILINPIYTCQLLKEPVSKPMMNLQNLLYSSSLMGETVDIDILSKILISEPPSVTSHFIVKQMSTVFAKAYSDFKEGKLSEEVFNQQHVYRFLDELMRRDSARYVTAVKSIHRIYSLQLYSYSSEGIERTDFFKKSYSTGLVGHNPFDNFTEDNLFSLAQKFGYSYTDYDKFNETAVVIKELYQQGILTKSNYKSWILLFHPDKRKRFKSDDENMDSLRESVQKNHEKYKMLEKQGGDFSDIIGEAYKEDFMNVYLYKRVQN